MPNSCSVILSSTYPLFVRAKCFQECDSPLRLSTPNFQNQLSFSSPQKKENRQCVIVVVRETMSSWEKQQTSSLDRKFKDILCVFDVFQKGHFSPNLSAVLHKPLIHINCCLCLLNSEWMNTDSSKGSFSSMTAFFFNQQTHLL